MGRTYLSRGFPPECAIGTVTIELMVLTPMARPAWPCNPRDIQTDHARDRFLFRCMLMEYPQNIYDDPAFFAAYEQFRDSGAGLNDILEQPALWSMLPDSLDGLHIIDLGCGFGDFARKARHAGAGFVLGIDCSYRMLERARERTDDPLIQYCRMPLEQLSIDDNIFDLAVSSLALHYVCDYRTIVRQIAPILKKGGRFIFSVEHPICTALSTREWIRNSAGDPMCWPIDEYRSEGPRRTQWFVEDVIKYHRTVETYVNGVINAGFRLLELREPAPISQASSAHPDIDHHRRRPPFLLLSAER